MNTSTLERPGRARSRPTVLPNRQLGIVRHFGNAPKLLPVEPGRYLVLGDLGQAPARRLSILLRLLGLDDAVPFLSLRATDDGRQTIEDPPRRLPPGLLGEHPRPDGYDITTGSTALLDARTGELLGNDPEFLETEFETSWRPIHHADAPDLYPDELRSIIDGVTNDIQELSWASTKAATTADKENVRRLAAGMESWLSATDELLAHRRFLLGEQLSAADIRLFVLLSDYERLHRPAFSDLLGKRRISHLDEFPQLWGYARDLFALGFMDQREAYHLGVVPDASGHYLAGTVRGRPGRRHDTLAAWREPSGRAHVAGLATGSRSH